MVRLGLQPGQGEEGAFRSLVESGLASHLEMMPGVDAVEVCKRSDDELGRLVIRVGRQGPERSAVVGALRRFLGEACRFAWDAVPDEDEIRALGYPGKHSLVPPKGPVPKDTVVRIYAGARKVLNFVRLSAEERASLNLPAGDPNKFTTFFFCGGGTPTTKQVEELVEEVLSAGGLRYVKVVNVVGSRVLLAYDYEATGHVAQDKQQAALMAAFRRNPLWLHTIFYWPP